MGVQPCSSREVQPYISSPCRHPGDCANFVPSIDYLEPAAERGSLEGGARWYSHCQLQF